MGSIRKSLLVGTTLGTAVVLSAGALFLFLGVRTGLVDQFDESLDDNARLYASTVEQRRKKGGVETDKLDMGEFEDPDRPEYLQLWGADGLVIFRSGALRGLDLARFDGPMDDPGHRWVALPGGRTGRAVGLSFTPLPGDRKPPGTGSPGGGSPETRPVESGSAAMGAAEGSGGTGGGRPVETLTLVLARDASPILDTLALLGSIIAVAGVATMGVSFAVLRVVIGRSLRPLDRLAAQIGGLEETDLGRRVDLPAAPRELEPLRDQLNDLLRRLEEAFRRERTLGGDVTHELRTPLAGLRSTLDVALSRARSPAEYREALGDCLSITRGMEDMVERLLTLFRLEMGPPDVRTRAISPDEVIRECWASFEPVAEARRIRVQWAQGIERAVVTDPALLRLVAQNLLENAATHADAGGWVSIGTASRDGGIEIRVSNSGSALSQEEAERAFDPFWRGDAGRTDVGTHCGLGLSLVKRVVEVLGGSARVRSESGGEFEVAVSIPDLDRAGVGRGNPPRSGPPAVGGLEMSPPTRSRRAAGRYHREES